MSTYDGEPHADGEPGAPNGSPEPLDLIPGFRDRLLLELDAAGVRPRRRIGELSRITGRASPTVRRWLDPEQPGLPDLESFARLAKSLQLDLSRLLGLVRGRPQPTEAPHGVDDWLLAVKRATARTLTDTEPFVMPGDDMAPRINDGDVVFVDKRVTTVVGNGIYLIEYMGRTTVRNVEDRLTEGLVLRCANERYADVLIPHRGATRPQLKIVGKVVGRLSIMPV